MPAAELDPIANLSNLLVSLMGGEEHGNFPNIAGSTITGAKVQMNESVNNGINTVKVTLEINTIPPDQQSTMQHDIQIEANNVSQVVDNNNAAVDGAGPSFIPVPADSSDSVTVIPKPDNFPKSKRKKPEPSSV